MSRKIVILRLKSEPKQTLGQGFVFDKHEKVFEFKTLELPWLDNKRKISCIPPGDYEVYKRFSKKNGQTFEFRNVERRNFVQIHAGNFHYDIQGCILAGKFFSDINSDGMLDVTVSRRTIEELYDLMPLEFPITIIDLT